MKDMFLIIKLLFSIKIRIIRHCYNTHRKEHGGKLNFGFFEYANFWIEHKPSDKYKMKSRDGSEVVCRVAYYPMPNYKDLRALIEFPRKEGTDFREVPIHYLERVK